jgi:ABC-type glycerol-3-phosphate transport system substrate-binding protein
MISRQRDLMTEYELLRIISFLEKTRTPYQQLIPIAEQDANWNIILFLMKKHLNGSIVTITILSSAANIPYASAMRRINRLISNGYIVRIPLSKTGKSFSLHPSDELIRAFIDYARRIKSLLADTFGLRPRTEDEHEFYFGGSYFAAQIIPPPRLIESLFRGEQELRFLLNRDNYFAAMSNMWCDFRNNMASRKNFQLAKLPELHARIEDNAARSTSKYDIIAINMPWVGEIASKGFVLPLHWLVEHSDIFAHDFHPSVWSMGQWKGEQYGIPIYCTIELLAARTDLFENDDITYPKTFDETVDAAKHFHNPSKEMFGIAWNGAEGMPIASTFMILMGCCGQTILNLRTANALFTVDKAQGDELRPNVVSDAGLEVLDYLHRLVAYSPPNILEMDWDERTEVFLHGHAALAYCWTVRAALFESDIVSSVKKRVKYLQHPKGPGGISNNPIGGFLLCIPSNLPEDRVQLAFEAIAWMTSPEAMKAHVQNGFPLAPRFSVSADPEVAATSPIVRVVDNLARRNLLKSLSRPAVPEFLAIETILGTQIHKALRGEIGDRHALELAQNQIDRTMRSAGYY